MTSEALEVRRVRPRTPFVALGVVGAVAVAAAAVTAVGADGTHASPRSTSYAAAAGASPLDAEIARTQQHLRDVPRDYSAWATLGFDYVQQAKLTVDPTYYPKADRALRRSLRLDGSDNFVAMAGEAALAAARHDFRGALRWSRRGLRVDPQSAVLYGTLTDALTQLGHYAAAHRAAVRMEELSPGTPAESRLSYAAELRGDVAVATSFMRQARADSAGPSDVAFTSYYLGQLALTTGHPARALRYFDAGRAADPADVTVLEGQARAEAALGHTAAALADFRTVVNRVPQPGYVLEYGELLQAAGHPAAAAAQWQLFRTEERLFRANGVSLDVEETLFEADHGNVATAVRAGARALRTRPFLDTYDAYGWALHRAGRDRAASAAVNVALHTGMHNALFYFHRGEIERSLQLRSAAIRDLGTAVRLDPTFSPLWAPHARADLAVLVAAR